MTTSPYFRLPATPAPTKTKAYRPHARGTASGPPTVVAAAAMHGRALVLSDRIDIKTAIGPHGESIPYCQHAWEAALCDVCQPSPNCGHQLLKYTCAICNPNGWCLHGRRAMVCRTCHHTARCPHEVWRRNCHAGCRSLDMILNSKRCCQSCGRWLGINKRQRKERLCTFCDTTCRQRTEHIVWEYIKDHLPYPSSNDNVLIGDEEVCHTARRRPDRTWVLADRVVDLEIDEHSHRDRLLPCELAKLDDTRWVLLCQVP